MWILFGLLIIGVILMLVGIVGSWFLVSIPEKFDHQPTRDDELSAAARALVGSFLRTLCGEGFEVVANFKLVDANSPISAVVINFVRRESGDMATILHASSGGYLMGFDTQFADGSRIVTQNQSDPGTFPSPSHERKLSVPGVRDPGLLYAIHRCRVKALSPAGVLVDAPGPGEEIERMHRDQAREIEWLLSARYVKPPVGGRYRATLKGAATAAWRLIPPGRWVVAWIQRLRARAELRSLGFDTFPPVVAELRS